MKHCMNCGNELKEQDEFCMACGNSVFDRPEEKAALKTKSTEKKLAIGSIVFGVMGIYPLLGIGGILGMILAKRGLRFQDGAYRRHLHIGYWISWVAFVFWTLALIVFLLGAFVQIFQDIWDLLIELIRLFI